MRYMLLVAGLLAATTHAFGQTGSFYGQFGNQTPAGGTSGLRASAWDDSFKSRRSGAVAGGPVGESIPPAKVSQQREAYEKERGQQLDLALQQTKERVAAFPSAEAIFEEYVRRRDLEGLLDYGQTRDPERLYKKWKASDTTKRSQLAQAYFDIRTAKLESRDRLLLATVGLAAIDRADGAAQRGDSAEESFNYSVARAAADLLVGIDPVTGVVRSAYEAFTGVNLITGERLDSFERGLAIFGVVSVGFGAEIASGLKIVGESAQAFKIADAAWEASLAYARHFGERFPYFRQIGRSSEDALRNYGSILREAAEGPRRRMERLLAKEGPAVPSTHIDPKSYRLGERATENLPPLDKPFLLARSEADAVGQAWVGPEFLELPTRHGRAVFTSKDGSRVYLGPVFKPREGAWQANLEVRVEFPANSGTWNILSDLHIDIVDPP